MRTSNPTGIDKDLRDKERRSLANFEEFENTLLILENKNEEEFDDLLNSFSVNIRNPLSEKVRQSLDNIKKRHSLIDVEKQQQDELNREKINTTPKSSKYESALSSEKNRLNETCNRSALISSTSSSSSGTGERLLRRSRLFDDMLSATTTIDTDVIETNSNATFSENTDNNRHESENNTTEILNQKNLPHLDKEYGRNEAIYNDERTENEGKPSKNRDRFKTIRIFKKPPENAVQVTDETFVQNNVSNITPSKRSLDAFAVKNTNSPQQLQANHGNKTNEQMMANQKAINTMTFRRPALARPNQLLSGVPKRQLYAKSNSHDLLSSDEHISLHTTFTHPKPVSQLKSPMGIKSKSIHNLMSTRSTQKSVSSADHKQTHTATASRPSVRFRFILFT